MERLTVMRISRKGVVAALPIALSLALPLAAFSIAMTAPGDAIAQNASGNAVSGRTIYRHDGRYYRDNRKYRHHKGGKDRRGSDSVPGIGTYSGSISATEDKGNGIYFYRDRRDNRRGKIARGTPGNAVGSPVINVAPGSNTARCDTSHGVCIIRP